MGLETLGRYLHESGSGGDEQMVRLLIQSIGLHAVDARHPDYESFNREITAILESLDTEATRDKLLVALGSVSQAMETYNSSITRFVSGQGRELQTMVSMLTRTLVTVASGSERSMRNLEAIESQLRTAGTVEDIKVLRVRLAECLTVVREEAARQRNENQVTIDVLQQELAARQRLSGKPANEGRDSVTGLALRAAAECAIYDAAKAPEPRYAVVGVVTKMQIINARFGYAIGNEILSEFANHVVARLSPQGVFYRWTGPSVVGILHRPEPLHVVRGMVSEVMQAPRSKSVTDGEKSALITSPAVWALHPLTTSPSEIIARIDKFVAEQIPQEA